MTIDTMTQLGILALSGTGIWLVGRPEPWRRWGYILGLSAQPFWFYMSCTPEMWGVAVLTLFCSYGWAQGVWFHWVKPEKVQPETGPPDPTGSTSETPDGFVPDITA